MARERDGWMKEWWDLRVQKNSLKTNDEWKEKIYINKRITAAEAAAASAAITIQNVHKHKKNV